MASFATDGKTEIVPNQKAKSAVWGHFGLKRVRETGTIANGVAVCKKCRMEVKYSGGTTNLNTHLERHHKIMSTSKSVLPAEQPKSSQPTLFELRSKTLDKYNINSTKAQSITTAVGGFIVKDMRPLSIVSNQGFQNMIKVLDPRYGLPSRWYFANSVIPKFYEQTKAKVLDVMSGNTVALTTDGWTSRATESYVTITASTITSDWSLKNFVLQTRALPENHTGVNIANVLKEAFEEWQISRSNDELITLVTDNAANMQVAAREAGCMQIGCYAHTLNLAAQKSLKIPAVARLLGRVRKVVSFFHRSTTAAAQLKIKTKLLGLKDVKLVQDVCTRWNSAVDMLERYLELQPAILAALVSKEVKHKDADLVTLDDKDVHLAEEIMTCLLPLREITQALCTETMPTLSIIRPIQYKLLSKILVHNDVDSNLIKQMKTAISTDLSTRYDKLKQFLDETSALDPRVKVQHLPLEEQMDVYNRLAVLAAGVRVKEEPRATSTATIDPPKATTTATNLPPLPQLPEMEAGPCDHVETEATKPELKPKTGLASILADVIFVMEEKPTKSRFQQVTEEVEKYKMIEVINPQSSPLEWWKTHEHEFRFLSQIARKRLCIPATSVPSERVFSTAGDIVTAQRAAIKPELVDILIFLKKNME